MITLLPPQDALIFTFTYWLNHWMDLDPFCFWKGCRNTYCEIRMA
jgi:hypothetical protein